MGGKNEEVWNSDAREWFQGIGSRGRITALCRFKILLMCTYGNRHILHEIRNESNVLRSVPFAVQRWRDDPEWHLVLTHWESDRAPEFSLFHIQTFQVGSQEKSVTLCGRRLFCLSPGRGLWDGPIPRREESYRLRCVVMYDIEVSRVKRPWPALGSCARKKN